MSEKQAEKKDKKLLDALQEEGNISHRMIKMTCI